jgi:Protein of unknown function (DUF3089)
VIRLKGLTPKRALMGFAAAFAFLAVIAVFGFRDDILRASIDPKAPFQTYRPPPAADYGQRPAWALVPSEPAKPSASDPPADVFFVHPTTYDNSAQWNAPLTDERSQHELATVMLPNYAGPFARVGRVFAPQYREATLFSLMTFRDDAQDARRLAYADVRRAFQTFVDRYNQGRPIVLVGVQEGGLIAARLLSEAAKDPGLRRRLVAAYLIDTAVPAEGFGVHTTFPACSERGETGCVVAWAQVVGGGPRAVMRRMERAVYWDPDGDLRPTKSEAKLCVNPVLGARTDAPAPQRLNLGAANATGLEWGARPAFLSRQVAAQCVDGVLEVSEPASGALKPSGSWAARKKAPGYNLFYADLEADAQARVRAMAARPQP